MSKHQTRLIAILILTVVAILGVVATLFVKVDAVGEVRTLLIGMITVLTPAAFDALAVESRRKDPNKKPIADNIVTPEVARAELASMRPPPPPSPTASEAP